MAVELRSKYYGIQVRKLMHLMMVEGPGDWRLMGPRSSDGAVLVKRSTATTTDTWLVGPTGEFTVNPAPAQLDPVEFGARATIPYV